MGPAVIPSISLKELSSLGELHIRAGDFSSPIWKQLIVKEGLKEQTAE